MKATKIKALIFDFDGLILDTETADYRSWSEVYEQHAVSLPFILWANGVGTSLDAFNPMDYLETLTGPLDRLRVKAGQKARLLELVDGLPLLPGVQAYLDEAQEAGLRRAIASTSDRNWINRHLTSHGLESTFDPVKTGDMVRRVKPFPDVYQAAIADLAIQPDEGIAFEDSPNGIRAAKAAGLKVVAVPNAVTRLLDTSQADLVLESLADMPLSALLERFEQAE